MDLECNNNTFFLFTNGLPDLL